MAAVKSHQQVSGRQGLLVQRRLVKVKEAYFDLAAQNDPAFLGDARAAGRVLGAGLVKVGIHLFSHRWLEDRDLQPLRHVAEVQPVFKRLVRVQNDVQQPSRLFYGIDFVQAGLGLFHG